MTSPASTFAERAPPSLFSSFSKKRGGRDGGISRRRVSSSLSASSSTSSSSTSSSSSSTSPENDLLRAMCTAVQLCSKLTSKTQKLLESSDQVSKSDDSPVTVADYAAQAVVCYVLEQKYPNVALLAEEDAKALRGDSQEAKGLLDKITEITNECVFGDDTSEYLSGEEVARLIDRGNHEGGSESTFFVLDPIDGTKGFINQRQYAIALGLCEKGKVVGGVLGCPNMPMKKIPEDVDALETEKPGVIFAAYKNMGCKYAAMDAKEPLGKDSFTATSDQMIKSGKDGARYMESWGDSIVADHAFTNALSEKVGITRKALRIDSQAKYGSLSRGDAHIYLRFPPKTYREKVWDHAAGAIIVSESGGVISDAAGEPLEFGKGRFLNINGGIIASATPELHEQLLKAIADLR